MSPVNGNLLVLETQCRRCVNEKSKYIIRNGVFYCEVPLYANYKRYALERTDLWVWLYDNTRQSILEVLFEILKFFFPLGVA